MCIIYGKYPSTYQLVYLLYITAIFFHTFYQINILLPHSNNICSKDKIRTCRLRILALEHSAHA